VIGRRSSAPKEDVGELSMLKRLNVLLGDRRRTVVALAATSLISGFAEAGTLALIAEVGASFVGHQKKVHIHLAGINTSFSIVTLLAIALGLALIRLLMQIPISILPSRIASEVQASLRTKLFHSYTAASWEVQSLDREGQLQDTMTSQTMQATGGAVGATGLISNSLQFFALLVTAFVLNPWAAAGILVSGVLIFIAVRPLKKLGVRRARALSRAQVSYAGGINEAIRLAEETHVFGVAGEQRKRIDELVQQAKRLFFSTQVLAKLVPNIFQSLILIMLVGALWVLHAIGVGNTPALVAIIMLLVRSARSGQQGLATFQSLSQTLPFIERTQEAERRYAESAPPEGDVPLQTVQTIAFRDVSYAYRVDQPVLSDVSFEVTRGEVVGVIGPTGAGKSTLIQLLLQLREPKAGSYLVNGVPAGRFVRADWHSRVVYVPQEPRLLHATVAENIRFDRDLGMPAVERAARLAHIHDEIMSWENGYETLVGPRADAVSGGQQQRLCLARALAARPEVLVLDEPTSALDPRSEARIQESLTELKQELTLFIIAHRMSTLDICDRVMVIMGGRLIAFDTIEALREHNAYYRSASAIATGSTR
jgi:ABC-type multidrug transport system fused ATPase/permease subunit